MAARVNRAQEGSLAGSVLQNVSRAANIYRNNNGKYPESMEGIAVEHTSDDLSKAFLRHVIYRRTENGFVAFVGIRSVSYVDSEGVVRFDLVR